jgi:hypothetical protein
MMTEKELTPEQQATLDGAIRYYLAISKRRDDEDFNKYMMYMAQIAGIVCLALGLHHVHINEKAFYVTGHEAFLNDPRVDAIMTTWEWERYIEILMQMYGAVNNTEYFSDWS